jgi:hypothetical protein
LIRDRKGETLTANTATLSRIINGLSLYLPQILYSLVDVVAVGPSVDVALNVGAQECGAFPKDTGGVVAFPLIHGHKSLAVSFIVMSGPILIIGWVKIEKLRVDFLHGTGQVHNLSIGLELKLLLNWDNLHPANGVDRGSLVDENQYESIWLYREKGHIHGPHHPRGRDQRE